MREDIQIRRQAACLETRAHIHNMMSRGVPADVALRRWFSEHREFGSRDRRLISQSIFAEFRWLGWVNRIEDTKRRLAIALALDGEEQAARLFDPGLPKLPPNAPLLDKAQWLEHAMPGICARVEDLVPDWTFDEIPDDGHPDFVARFVEILQKRPPLWLRARTGQTDSALHSLRNRRVVAEPDPRLPGAIRVEPPVSSAILSSLQHTHVEIQDYSSQKVGHFCAPNPGEQWWDACAGAGGKALHLLDLTEDRAEVICTDIRPPALNEFKRRARAAGFTRWKAVVADPTKNQIDRSLRFDGILIDAPCSGTGTWNRNPDARHRANRSELSRFASRQVELIKSVLPSLKENGRIIYAVCSLTRTETVDVIQRCCAESPLEVRRALRIDPMEGPGIGMWAAELVLRTH